MDLTLWLAGIASYRILAGRGVADGDEAALAELMGSYGSMVLRYICQ